MKQSPFVSEVYTVIELGKPMTYSDNDTQHLALLLKAIDAWKPRLGHIDMRN